MATNTMATTHENNNAIEVDPSIYDDTDSEFGSSGYETSTQSLTSSVNQFIFENGRRYHAYFGTEKNLMPTDEMEQNRLDMYHEICLHLQSGDLHKCPIEDPQRILDLGTGTGIWAVDAADKFPCAEVIGIDLSPIQPEWVPPNCRFELDDIEREWTFKEEMKFDLIHARNVASSITNYKKLMQQIYHYTAPGGYVEIAETGAKLYSNDGYIDPDHAYKRHFVLFEDPLIKLGRPPLTGETMREHLGNAGFEVVHVYNIKEPLGTWPKERRLKYIGAMCQLQLETGVQAYGLALLTRVHGMTDQEALEFCDRAVKAAKDKKSHLYNYFHVAYGRKPMGEEK